MTLTASPRGAGLARRSGSSTPTAGRSARLVPAGTCKYHPSCSEYALGALRKHGLVKGSALAVLARSCAVTRGRTAGSTTRDRRCSSSASSPRSRTRSPGCSTASTTTSGSPGPGRSSRTTIVVRILLVPLTVRQIHSMQSLQKHAPEMKEIQRKYKGDKQKQHEELMRFYKENHINPAASCLPFVAQLPVFISLYLVLKHFSKHIPPGSDLSWLHFVPDITAKADSHWSGFVLLAVYAASQISSTYFMSQQMDKTQRTTHDGAAARLHHGDRALQGRARHLLGDDEPLDGRPGPRHPPARAADGGRPRRCHERSSRAPTANGGATNGSQGQEEPAPKPKPAVAGTSPAG